MKFLGQGGTCEAYQVGEHDVLKIGDPAKLHLLPEELSRLNDTIKYTGEPCARVPEIRFISNAGCRQFVYQMPYLAAITSLSLMRKGFVASMVNCMLSLRTAGYFSLDVPTSNWGYDNDGRLWFMDVHDIFRIRKTAWKRRGLFLASLMFALYYTKCKQDIGRKLPMSPDLVERDHWECLEPLFDQETIAALRAVCDTKNDIDGDVFATELERIKNISYRLEEGQ